MIKGLKKYLKNYKPGIYTYTIAVQDTAYNKGVKEIAEKLTVSQVSIFIYDSYKRHMFMIKELKK